MRERILKSDFSKGVGKGNVRKTMKNICSGRQLLINEINCYKSVN